MSEKLKSIREGVINPINRIPIELGGVAGAIYFNPSILKVLIPVAILDALMAEKRFRKQKKTNT